MIVEALIDLAAGLFGFLVDLIGTAQPPAFLTGLAGQLDSLVAAGASMGTWVPWSVLGTAIAAVVACFAVSFVIRVARMLISVFTGGGGSAA